MKVSEYEEQVTHVVLGGSGDKIKRGSISEDPFFFETLQKNIYERPINAAIRETICNAWDAHIEASLTDTPIKITLKDNYFIVQDFGKGIHDDDMEEVYLTYGGSTKRKNGAVTGGFGLGCKAPWAICETFMVDSAHEGIKTIYSMPKNNNQADNKPGAVPITSFPTEESGLTVKIPVGPNLFESFEQIIKEVIFYGGINATLNDKPLETIDYSKRESNWVLVRSRRDDYYDRTSKISVKLGSVIYPFPNTPNRELNKKLETFSKIFSYEYGLSSYRIIFIAEPGTLIPQPNREKLSLQETTINTLESILDSTQKISLLKFSNQEVNFYSDKLINSLIEKKDTKSLLLLSASARDYSDHNDDPHIVYTYSDMRLIQFQTSYNFNHKGYVPFIQKCIKASMNLPGGSLGDKQRLYKFYGRQKHNNSYAEELKVSTNYIHNRSIRELIKTFLGQTFKKKLCRDLLQDPNMKPSNLAFVSRDEKFRPADWFFWDKDKSVRTHITDFYTFMCRKVVLTHYINNHTNEKLMKLYFEEHPEPGLHKTMVYYCSRNKESIEHSREFFKSRGYSLIDLTDNEAEWIQPYLEDKEKAKQKKKNPTNTRGSRPKGHPSLDTAYDGTSAPHAWRFDNCFDPGKNRILAPAAYIAVRRSKGSWSNMSHGVFDMALMIQIAKLLGKDIAVVTDTSETFIEKLIENGVPEIQDYVYKTVTERVTTDPEFIQYWITSGIDTYLNKTESWSLIKDIPGVKEVLDISVELSEDNENYLKLYDSLAQNHHYQSQDFILKYITPAQQLINGWCVNEHYNHIVSCIPEKLFEVFNFQKLEKFLNSPLKDCVQVMILNAIKALITIEDNNDNSTVY